MRVAFMSKFQPIKVYGEGGQGIAMMVSDLADGGRYKIMKLFKSAETIQQLADGKTITTKSDERLDAEKELRTVMPLSHPNVQPVSEVYEDEAGNLVNMTPVVFTGDLQNHIELALSRQGPGKPIFEYSLIFSIFYQIVNAMTFLHLRGIAHRDLKPENILYFHYGVVRVFDFGVAKFMGFSGGMLKEFFDDEEITKATAQGQTCMSQTKCAGTFGYIPPETLLVKKKDESIKEYRARCKGFKRYDVFKQDSFAIGVILYYLLTGKRVFDFAMAKGDNDIKHMISDFTGEVELPSDIPPFFKAILQSLLKPNPNDRMTVIEVFGLILGQAAFMNFSPEAVENYVSAYKEIGISHFGKHGSMLNKGL